MTQDDDNSPNKWSSTVKALDFALFLGSLLWLFIEPGFEPLIGLVSSVLVFLLLIRANPSASLDLSVAIILSILFGMGLMLAIVRVSDPGPEVEAIEVTVPVTVPITVEVTRPVSETVVVLNTVEVTPYPPTPTSVPELVEQLIGGKWVAQTKLPYLQQNIDSVSMTLSISSFELISETRISVCVTLEFFESGGSQGSLSTACPDTEFEYINDGRISIKLPSSGDEPVFISFNVETFDENRIVLRNSGLEYEVTYVRDS